MKDSDFAFIIAYILVSVSLVIAATLLIIKLNHWWPVLMLLCIPSMKIRNDKNNEDPNH